ncbi:MAG TPA: biopolymer transporter ExbD, partial [Flavobacterium sp.]|nr:biopolymer transporter ExbD [Flavobacterium sp.]
MDESNKNFRLIKAKPRCKQLKPKIDLAAMVSVSFLLIIFFMVTKELSKPQIMDFGLPE